jgi:hypothetical protein
MSSRLKKRADQDLDSALADSFPASDPPAMTEPGTPVASPVPDEPISHQPHPGPDAALPSDRDLGRDERIRRRAYEIWARAGHPAGREVEHWYEAEQEIDDEDREKAGPITDLPASARDLATGHG